MEINITTEKTKALVAGDHGVTKEFIKVEISDQDLLKLGRRYFELASGNGKAETTFNEWKEKELEKDPEFGKEYIISIAHDIKMYCNQFINCKKCPLCINPGDNDGGGTYYCRLDGCPSSWEV